MTQQEIEFARWCVANDIHRFYVWGRWKQVRQQVLDMDHNECQRCREQHKYTAATTVHHVNYVKRHPEMALDIWYEWHGVRKRNLISLWSSIYDLLLYIKDKEKAKPLEDIQQDLDIIEYSCRKYADVDDEEISMENEQISRAEHEEFCKRIEAEDNRQNRRIEILENSVQQLQELVTSVQTLANNMENMVKEQGQQSARLEALESRDGEKWRTVTSYLLTAILGIAVGIIAKQFGI